MKDNFVPGSDPDTVSITGESAYYSSSEERYFFLDFSCTLYVSELIPANSVVITPNDNPVKLKAGDTIDLDATVNPDTATFPSVTWTSGDNSIATVDENGVVTAVSDGSTTITANTIGASASVDIIVKSTRHVTYELNGGTGVLPTPDPSEVAIGTPIEILGGSVSRAANVYYDENFDGAYNQDILPCETVYIPFAKWNTSADGSGTDYAVGSTYTGAEDLTL